MPKQSIAQAAPEHKRRQRPAAAPAADAHPLVSLQRQLGNAQVSRMLAGIQREGEEDELATKRDPSIQREGEEDELATKRDPSIQREGEEDELATKRDPSIQREGEEDELATKRDPSIQREGEEDELAMQREPEEDELATKRDPSIQRQAADAGPEVGPEGGPISGELNSRIQGMRGGGSGLDDGVRSRMEGQFGADFSGVRVHTGGEAAAASRQIGATAFTTGSDIFFGGNASPSDERLLAHELTHVVQQGGTSSGGPLTVGPADDANEQQAEQVASQVSSPSH